MESIEILSEHEVPNGWAFDAEWIGPRDGRRHRRTLRLAWADYNHWSVDGTDPPQRVAEAVLRFLLSRLEAESLLERFDASVARRRFADADEEIPKLIRR